MGATEAGELEMDAYSEVMMRLSDARLADLCREAQRDRLAAPLVGRRRRSKPVAEVTDLPASDRRLRRSA
jgi:hypothetical protein